MWGKLPATLALFAVLGPLHPCTIKPFLPSFLSRRHSREKRYQALSRFTVLIVTESWAGPGNEAMIVMWAWASCWLPGSHILTLANHATLWTIIGASLIKVKCTQPCTLLQSTESKRCCQTVALTWKRPGVAEAHPATSGSVSKVVQSQLTEIMHGGYGCFR